MNYPSVTVCMPTYNRPEFLRDAASSVLRAASHYSGRVQLYICSDGGELIVESAGVPSTVDLLVERVPTRFAHLGAKRQHMLTRATSEWVTWVDDDDAVMPWHFRPFYELATEPAMRVLVWQNWFEVFLGSDRRVESYRWNEACGILFAAQRSLVDHVGGFDVSMDRGEDTRLRNAVLEAVGKQRVKIFGPPSYIYQHHRETRATKSEYEAMGEAAGGVVSLDGKLLPVQKLLRDVFHRDLPAGRWYEE